MRKRLENGESLRNFSSPVIVQIEEKTPEPLVGDKVNYLKLSRLKFEHVAGNL
jgi:hypothetical protein